jgi:YVTN family beta-propeller protein
MLHKRNFLLCLLLFIKQIKFSKVKKIFIVAIATIAIITSCKKDSTTSTDITYKAAYIVNGGSNSISVIDLSTNTVARTINLTGGTFPHHISINPTNSQIAVAIPNMDLSMGHDSVMAGMAGMFMVYNATNCSMIKMQNLPLMCHNAIFSPNGTEIWAAQMDSMGKVLVYDATTYALKNTINVGMMPLEVSFSKDATMAFVCNMMDGTVTAIDANNKTVMTTINVGMNPIGAWQGADNKMYVDNEMDSTVSVINVATMSNIATINLGFKAGMVAYNNNDATVWVTDGENGKVTIFKKTGSTYTTVSSITTAAGAHGIAFNADYTTAYVTNQMAGSVSVINVATKTKTTDITVGNKPNGLVLKQ